MIFRIIHNVNVKIKRVAVCATDSQSFLAFIVFVVFVLQNSPVTQHQIRYIVETALRHVNEV